MQKWKKYIICFTLLTICTIALGIALPIITESIKSTPTNISPQPSPTSTPNVGSPETKSDSYLTLLTIIAGFLAAFSAISIYSIFNANIDREKDKVESLKTEQEKLTTKINDLDTSIRERTGQLAEIDHQIKKQIIQQNVINESDKNADKRISQIDALFFLTSPFISSRMKRDAISELKTLRNLNPNIKIVVRDYYLSIKDKKKETTQLYFPELEELLEKWKKFGNESPLL